MRIYPWLVVIHVAAVLGFVLAHGNAALTSLRLRRQHDVDSISALVQMAELSNTVMYPFFWLMVIAGVVAAINGNWFHYGWPWAAIGLLLVITIAMYAIATPYYRQLRVALGLRGPGRGSGRGQNAAPATRAPDVQILEMVQSRRPEIIAAIGGIGLLLLVWLMVMKPF